jgi:phage tail-like protein
MTRPLNSDPLRNFRYKVSIAPPTSTTTSPIPATISSMGFMALSGLSVNNEVIPYREGGNNTTTRKMPGQSDYGPLTLTRGFMAAPVGGGNAGTNELYLWFGMIFAVNVGGGLGTPGAQFRTNVTIDVYDHPVTGGSGPAGKENSTSPATKARFVVYNAWPMGYSFSDLEAGGNAVFIENLTLAHEGWGMVTAGRATPPYLGSQQPTQ